MDARFLAADIGAEGLVALGVLVAGALWLATRIARARRRDREGPEPTGREERQGLREEPAGAARPREREEEEEGEEEQAPATAAQTPSAEVEPKPKKPTAQQAPLAAPPDSASPKPEEKGARAGPSPAEPAGPQRRESDADREGLRKGLASTRGGLLSRLGALLKGKDTLDPALVSQIEEAFITSDIGVKTTAALIERMRAELDRKALSDPAKVWAFLRGEAERILAVAAPPLTTGKPHVIMVVGVNGVGKTTTIGKLASRLHADGKKVVLAAGDTFRAAAVAQLEVWGRRTGCPVVRGKEGSDPSSVIFDAIKQAQKDGADYVIADTAGRLHTKTPLMEELKKVGRVMGKAFEGAPHEALLVLDATTGQNAIAQAQMFKEALRLTGLVLTKLDGTAKGGVILGICDEHKIPVRYIGIGERVEDLREFSAAAFVDALLYRAEEDSIAA